MTKERAGHILRVLAIGFVVLVFVTNPADAGKAVPMQSQPVDRAAAQDVFEHLKKLQGNWIGKSTKGWEEQASIRVIAGSSAIVEQSVDAHPGEEMLTVFHMDGGRLILTHYCVAGNQPRLVATSSEDNGRTITFTFLDATNLPSRDKGHMDKVVLQFVDDNHFTSQWTWYQNGSEQWMERIESRRVGGMASTR